jgi:hypothetical protein
MPIGWYIVPYEIRITGEPIPTRYCAIDDYTPQIYAAGGQWAETEVLGNRAIVKVRAPAAGLSALDATYRRIPKNRLDDSLADLPAAIKVALRDEIQDQGYSLVEIRARFGDDLGAYTLRDVLRFMASRRLQPRWDWIADEIILDGPAQACRSVESVDAEVKE